MGFPEHNRVAQHNEKANRYVQVKPEFVDWDVTTLFYSALHYADAILSRTYNAPDFNNHDDRESFMRRNNIPFYSPYRQLREASQKARYDCENYNSFNEKELKRLRSDLQKIKEHTARKKKV